MAYPPRWRRPTWRRPPPTRLLPPLTTTTTSVTPPPQTPGQIKLRARRFSHGHRPRTPRGTSRRRSPPPPRRLGHRLNALLRREAVDFSLVLPAPLFLPVFFFFSFQVGVLKRIWQGICGLVFLERDMVWGKTVTIFSEQQFQRVNALRPQDSAEQSKWVLSLRFKIHVLLSYLRFLLFVTVDFWLLTRLIQKILCKYEKHNHA